MNLTCSIYFSLPHVRTLNTSFCSFLQILGSITPLPGLLYFALSYCTRGWRIHFPHAFFLASPYCGCQVHADLSTGEPPEQYDTGHRNVNKDLAGGALLDLGVYALLWVFQTAYHTAPPDKRKAPIVQGAVMSPEPRTGADEATTMLLEFPVSAPTGSRKTHAIATTAMRVHFDPDRDTEGASPTVRIQGEKGEIQVFGPIYVPGRIKLVPYPSSPDRPIQTYNFPFPGGIHGMSWEGDEAARCWLAGKLESKMMLLDELILIMEVCDDAIGRVDLDYGGLRRGGEHWWIDVPGEY